MEELQASRSKQRSNAAPGPVGLILSRPGVEVEEREQDRLKTALQAILRAEIRERRP